MAGLLLRCVRVLTCNKYLSGIAQLSSPQDLMELEALLDCLRLFAVLSPKHTLYPLLPKLTRTLTSVFASLCHTLQHLRDYLATRSRAKAFRAGLTAGGRSRHPSSDSRMRFNPGCHWRQSAIRTARATRWTITLIVVPSQKFSICFVCACRHCR